MAQAPTDVSDLGVIEKRSPLPDFSDLGVIEPVAQGAPDFSDLGELEPRRIEPPADLSGVKDARAPIFLGRDYQVVEPYRDPNAALRADTTGPVGRTLRFIGQKLEPITPKRTAFPFLNAADLAAGDFRHMLGDYDPETGEVSNSQFLPDAPAPTWAKVATGAERGVAQVAGAAMPWVIAGPLVGGATRLPLAARTVSAVFAADMIRQLPDQVQVFLDAVDKGDTQTAVQAGVGGSAGALLASLALYHAVAPTKVPRLDALGNPIIDPATGEPAFDTRGIAQESPAIRALLTRKITTEYTPEQIKEVYSRVNLGQANPAEQELVRFINSALERPGEAVRKGATVTEAFPRIENEFWRKFLGLKEGERTVTIAGEKPAQPTGGPSAVNPVSESGGVQSESARTLQIGKENEQTKPRDRVPSPAGQPPERPNAPAQAAQAPVSLTRDAAIKELRLEGVTQADAEALVDGKKTVKDVVEGNFKITPSRVVGEEQGHDEAFVEGYNQAIERLSNIVRKSKPALPSSATKETPPAAEPIKTTPPPPVKPPGDAIESRSPEDQARSAEAGKDMVRLGQLEGLESAGMLTTSKRSELEALRAKIKAAPKPTTNPELKPEELVSEPAAPEVKPAEPPVVAGGTPPVAPTPTEESILAPRSEQIQSAPAEHVRAFEELRNITIDFNNKKLSRKKRDALIPRAQELRSELSRAGYTPDQIKDVEMGKRGVPLPESAPAAPAQAPAKPEPLDTLGNPESFYATKSLMGAQMRRSPKLAAAMKFYGVKTVKDLNRLATRRFAEMREREAVKETSESHTQVKPTPLNQNVQTGENLNQPFVAEILQAVAADPYALTKNITRNQQDEGYTDRLRFKSGSQEYIALLRPEKRNTGSRAMFNHPEQLDVFHSSDTAMTRRLARIDFSEISKPAIAEVLPAPPVVKESLTTAAPVAEPEPKPAVPKPQAPPPPPKKPTEAPPVAPVEERSETLADRMRGQRSATIGTVTSDAGVFSMSVRPDNSAGGLSVVLSNKEGSQSIRMNYRYDMTLADLRKSFQEYLNIDNPGKFTVEISQPKPAPTEAAPLTLKQEWKRQLKEKKSIRYKTATDEKAIERLKAKIANDPSKWSAGDGVGYRVNSGRGTQVNRGFRIVDADRDAETVTVRQVADTGLTSSGGNYDTIRDQVIDMVDLVRDNKYTLQPSAAPAIAPAVEEKSREQLIREEIERAIPALEDQLADIKRRRKEVRAQFKGQKPISTFNRTTPRIARGQEFQRALDNLDMEESGAARGLEQYRKRLAEIQTAESAAKGYSIGEPIIVERSYGVDATVHKWPGNKVTITARPDLDVSVYKAKSGWIVNANGISVGKSRKGVGSIGFDTPQEAVENYLATLNKTPEVKAATSPNADMAGGEYAVDFESASGDRIKLVVSSEKYADLSDEAKEMVDRAYKTTLEFNEKDFIKWEKIKQGKSKVTVTERIEGSGKSRQSVTLDSPEVEFGSWAKRTDLHDAKFNPKGEALRDKLFSEREAEAKSKADKEAADRAEYERKAKEFRDYSETVSQTPLPAGKKTTLEITSKEGVKSQLEGTRYGDWFIHKVGPVGHGRYADPVVYKVSHVASGLGVSDKGLPTLENAKNYVRALIHANVRADFKQASDLSKEEHKAISEVARAWVGGGDVPSYFKPAPPTTLPLEGWDTTGPGEDQADTRYEDLLRSGTDAATMLDAMEANAENGFEYALIQKLKSLGLKTTVRMGAVNESPSPTTTGYYGSDKDEILVFERATNRQKVLLHEFVHAATAQAVADSPAFRLELEAMLQEARAAIGTSSYGTRNVYEFLAEAFSNPGFQERLDSIGGKQSLWQRFLAWLRRIFGIKDKDASLLERVIRRSAAEFRAPRNTLVASNAVTTLQPGLVRIGGAKQFPAVTAYHGTPHEVDQFTTAKIGTGEGAQVYGWGLYFAENPEVGRYYKKGYGNMEVDGKYIAVPLYADLESGKVKPTPEIYAAKAVHSSGASAIHDLESSHDTFPDRVAAAGAIKLINEGRVKPAEGNEYTVTLNAEPDELLDWDKPVQQQSEKIQNFVLDTLARRDVNFWNQNPTGAELYRRLQGEFRYGDDPRVGPREASEELRSLGIKGIRYADQGSRNINVIKGSGGKYPQDYWLAQDTRDYATPAKVFFSESEAEAWAASQRTYNYVIFDDKDITITHRNGQQVTPSEMAGAQGGQTIFPMEEAVPEGGRPVVNGEELAGDEHVQIAGVDYTILGKEKITPAQLAAAAERTRELFQKDLKLPGVPDRSYGKKQGATDTNVVFRIVPDGQNHDEAGQRLIEHFTEQVKQQFQPGGDPAYVSQLANAIKKNFVLGNWNGVLSESVMNDLVERAAADASFKGQLLRAQTGIQEDVQTVARNAPFFLRRIYSERFGGENVNAVLEKLLTQFRDLLTDQEIADAMNGAPALAKALNKVTGNRAAEILRRIFASPFDSQKQVRQKLVTILQDELKVSRAEAKAIGDLFDDAFTTMFNRIAQASLAMIEKAMTARDRQVLGFGRRRGIWQRIKDAVNKGNFNAAYVLQRQADSQRWNIPTEADLAKVRAMAEEIDRLLQIPERRVREIGDNPAELERERVRQRDATSEMRVELKRKIESYWSRWTLPLTPRNPKGRANIVSAIYEHTAAVLLLKPGFITRQTIDVSNNALLHIPFRALGHAIVLHGGFKANATNKEFWDDANSLFKQAARVQIQALPAALREFKEALKGTAEIKNVDRLLSGIALFERVQMKADELQAAGNTGQAFLLRAYGLVRFSYRFASALDNLQGVPQEWQEIRSQAYRFFRENGMSIAEAKTAADRIVPDLRSEFLKALPESKRILEAGLEPYGRTPTIAQIEAGAFHIVKGMAYLRMQEAGMPADDFESRNRLMRSTNAWNESMAGVASLGGVVSTGMKKLGEVGQAVPVPLGLMFGAFGRFGNAIGTGIDRALTMTPMGMVPAAFGVRDEYIDAETGLSSKGSPWFRTAEDRATRSVESAVFSTLGALFIALVLAGYIVVRNRWPKDPKKRDEWERNGWKPGTVAIQVGDGKEIPVSMTVGPFAPLRPYFAAAGSLRDSLDRKAEQQAALDAKAAKFGLTPGKAKGLGLADAMALAVETGWASIMGGRTASGLIGSITDYGTPNAAKSVSAAISPYVPGLPAIQEISRMAGVMLDQNSATVADFLVPLPSSPHAKVNVLGDPAGTPHDLQRIVQVLTGGTFPGITENDAGKANSAYAALFGSGYRPPAVSPNQGYPIGGEFRPMTPTELEAYTVARGQALKEELSGVNVEGLPENEARKVVQAAYQRANRTALASVGVSVPASAARAATGVGASGAQTLAGGPVATRGLAVPRGTSRLGPARGNATLRFARTPSKGLRLPSRRGSLRLGFRKGPTVRRRGTLRLPSRSSGGSLRLRRPSLRLV